MVKVANNNGTCMDANSDNAKRDFNMFGEHVDANCIAYAEIN
jgi:hypothetical protein